MWECGMFEYSFPLQQNGDIKKQCIHRYFNNPCLGTYFNIEAFVKKHKKGLLKGTIAESWKKQTF